MKNYCAQSSNTEGGVVPPMEDTLLPFCYATDCSNAYCCDTVGGTWSDYDSYCILSRGTKDISKMNFTQVKKHFISKLM